MNEFIRASSETFLNWIRQGKLFRPLTWCFPVAHADGTRFWTCSYTCRGRRDTLRHRPIPRRHQRANARDLHLAQRHLCSALRSCGSDSQRCKCYTCAPRLVCGTTEAMRVQAPLQTDPVREIISELGSVPAASGDAEAASSQTNAVTLALATGTNASEEGGLYTVRLLYSSTAPLTSGLKQQRPNRSSSCSRPSKECSQYSRSIAAVISRRSLLAVSHRRTRMSGQKWLTR